MAVYKPLSPQKWKPVQFIDSTYPNSQGITTDGEAGKHRLDTIEKVIGHMFDLKARGFVIYSMYEGRKLSEATIGTLWTVHYWNGRVSFYMFAGKIKIYPISSISRNPEEVWPFFQWLRQVGIVAGSFTSIAQATWRLSLTDNVTFFDYAKEGRNSLYGGRKEAIRGTFHHMRYQDLSAAFPTAMADNLYPRTIRETSRARMHDYGYALATINIPKDLPWYPIPCRLGKRAVVYGYGTQTDWWTFSDLQNVEEVGGQVVIHRAFKGFDTRPVFRDWWYDIMLPLRNSLMGDAQLAAKTAANRLWSSFAIGGTGKVAQYTDDKRRTIIERTVELKGVRYEAYIAAQTQALVRTRVLDALYDLDNPVYVDTDGIICRNKEDYGDGWRIKREMRRVDVHSCQNYKWECYRCGVYSNPWCGGPHYALALPQPNQRAAETALGHVEMPVNPLFGVTVSPIYDLETLRRKWKYEQPRWPGSENIPWDTYREGAQQRIST